MQQLIDTGIQNKIRENSIDIARGLGIILMVLGHANMPHSSVIFRFHMALFFIISGWCFSDRYIGGKYKVVLEYVWKKIKGLYVPFVLFNGITLLLNNIFIKINILTDNELFLEDSAFGGNIYGISKILSMSEMKNHLLKVFQFLGSTQLGGATWFLRIMFGVSIMWCIVNWLLKSVAKFDDYKRMCINVVLSIFLVIVFWNWQKSDTHLLLQFQSVASSYIMFCVGYYLKKKNMNFETLQNAVIAVLAFFILIFCDNFCNKNGWDSNVSIVSNPIMYIVSSLSGFFLIFTIAQILSKIKCFKILEILGKHTLSVLLLHFLCFKIVTLYQCIRYNYPLYRIASFPVYNARGKWWIIYSIVGVGIPLLLSIFYSYIKTILKNSIKKLQYRIRTGDNTFVNT